MLAEICRSLGEHGNEQAVAPPIGHAVPFVFPRPKAAGSRRR